MLELSWMRHAENSVESLFLHALLHALHTGPLVNLSQTNKGEGKKAKH